MTQNSGFHYEVTSTDLVSEKMVILDIWKANLGHADPEAKFDCYYLNNPFGKGEIFVLKNLLDNQKVVGVSGLGARRWFIDDNPYTVYTMGDFAVDSSHRSLGPALSLSRASFTFSEDNAVIVYGIPNRKATPVIKRVGYTRLGALTRYVKIFKSRSKLEQYVPNFLLTIVSAIVDSTLYCFDKWNYHKSRTSGCEVESEGDEIDTIWSSLDKKGLVLSERTSLFMNWKISTYSKQQPMRLFLVKDRKGKKPIGYVLFYLGEDEQAIVIDFLAIDCDEHLKRVLHCFSNAVRQFDVHSVSLEFFGRESVLKLLAKSLFRARGNRQLFIHGIEVKMEKITGAVQWYMTSTDEDE